MFFFYITGYTILEMLFMLEFVIPPLPLKLYCPVTICAISSFLKGCPLSAVELNTIYLFIT